MSLNAAKRPDPLFTHSADQLTQLVHLTEIRARSGTRRTQATQPKGVFLYQSQDTKRRGEERNRRHSTEEMRRESKKQRENTSRDKTRCEEEQIIGD